MEKEPNVLKQYADLKAQHPDRMLLFRNDRYYQLFNEDAKEAVRILGINGVQFRNDPDTATALFEHEKLDIYLPKLIRAGKRVAICDMLPDPPKTKRGITETINNESTNNQTSEDKTMATKKNNNNESANVQNNAQVNNAAIEDVNVGEVTVDSIMPVMQPVEGSEYTVESDGKTATFESMAPNIGSEPAAPTKQEVAEAICKAANEGKATTMPLGSHGTLVIAGVGSNKPKPEMPKRDKNGKFLKKSEDKPKVQDSVPQTSASYRVALVPSKDGIGQWPKLYGFQSEADAEKMTKKMAKSIRNSWDRDEQGEKRFYIKGGKKYCDVFQELCNALNAGDKAAIDKACKRTVAIYDGAVADGKAESAAKKAEREAKKSEKSANASTTSYSDQDVADMLRKVMAGGDVPENIKKLLQAA